MKLPKLTKHVSIGGVVAAGLLLAAPIPSGLAGREPRAVQALARPQAPERPRVRVDTKEAAQTGRVIRVRAGGSLQAALDEASPGDSIALEPGATYEGPFRLRRKEGTGWIVIASRTPPSVSSRNRHVTPSDAPKMPKLTSASGAVITAEAEAHHYRIVGLEIAPVEGVFLKALVELGASERKVEDLPHHIIIDRCYLHGDRRRGARRGVAMNARHAAVVHSYLSDFKEVGTDSQAIAGWNGDGPFRIADNYLEGAGENVMFGGADPAIPGLVPADIEVVGNHIAKPLTWKLGDPKFEGTAWAVKNLFELKNARRVLIDGNLLEYNWPHAQNGFAILFTVRNQDGESPWSTIEDVTFINNLVRHAAAGINILGRDDIHTSRETRRIAIENNLFVDIGGRWGGGRLLQLLDGVSDVRIAHNTALQNDTAIWAGEGVPHERFVFANNIVAHNQYGIIGAHTTPGRQTLERYFPGATVRRNVFIGGKPANYPRDNFFAVSLGEIRFADARAGNYRLTPSSPFRNAASEGGDPGADLSLVARGYR
jgi:hypothetical protein